jgi:hydroxymethylbilane synthase
MKLRIGTRRSALAQTQTRHVISLIKAKHPDVECDVKLIMSVADRDRKSEFHEFKMTGVFTTEHEESLVRNDVDIVVHSLKDLPTKLMDGLVLAAVPTREDPRDAICGLKLADLKKGARVGTASLRRKAQIMALRPDVEVVPIRGNLQPRLNRTKGADKLDAVILAAAGLARLDLADQIAEVMDATLFPYAVGQGALGVECRADDQAIIDILADIQCSKARIEVDAERALLHALGAGCSLPVGVWTEWQGNQLTLSAQITALNGQEKILATVSGPASDPVALGIKTSDQLRDKGGAALLESTYRDLVAHFKLH